LPPGTPFHAASKGVHFMLPTGIPGPSSRRLLALALGLTLIAGFSNPGQRSASAANQGTKSVATGNIAEIVKIIDEGLESGWAKNKITPSAACDDH
jgi:hypothetical protein